MLKLESKNKKEKRIFLTNDFTRKGLCLLLIFSFIATVIGFTTAYCEHRNYSELLTKYDEAIERISQCEVSIADLMTQSTTCSKPDLTMPSDNTEKGNPSASDSAQTHQGSEKESDTTKSETASGYYVTQSGKKYHIASCSYLTKSKISISLERIRAEGYSPCSRCIK